MLCIFSLSYITKQNTISFFYIIFLKYFIKKFKCIIVFDNSRKQNAKLIAKNKI